MMPSPSYHRVVRNLPAYYYVPMHANATAWPQVCQNARVVRQRHLLQSADGSARPAEQLGLRALCLSRTALDVTLASFHSISYYPNPDN